MNVYSFWKDVLAQNREALHAYFAADAYVNWHCTNEHFTAEEFIRANCEYPGEWDGEIERTEQAGDLLITVTRVFPKDRTRSFHVTSFFRLKDGKILSLDEYWADDGAPPQWRIEKHIGKAIV